MPSLSIQPILGHPHEAVPGGRYVFTVDLRLQEGSEWTEGSREEVTFYCMSDAWPLFHCDTSSAPVVLHRFGSYGPARFVLTASDQESSGRVSFTLVNEWGLPLAAIQTDEITIRRSTSHDVETDDPLLFIEAESVDSLTTIPDGFVVCGGTDGCIRLWNMPSGNMIQENRVGSGPVQVVFLNAGYLLYATGSELKKNLRGARDSVVYARFSVPISALAISESENTIAVGLEDGSFYQGNLSDEVGEVRLSISSSGRKAVSVAIGAGPEVVGVCEDGSVVSTHRGFRKMNGRVAIAAPDGSQIYIGRLDGVVETLGGGYFLPLKPGSPVTALCLHGTSPRFLIAGHENGTMELFDADTGIFLDSVQAHTSGVIALVMLDGKDAKIVSGSRNGTIKVWPLLRPTVRPRIAALPNREIARMAIRYQQEASQFVQVAGTGAHQLNDISQQAAEGMGAALAANGFGLITCAWPGVDSVAAKAYVKNGGKSLIHILSRFSLDPSPDALTVETTDPQAPVKLADAVVLIGGRGGTKRAFDSARELGTPAFPYAATGGDAEICAGMLGPTEAGLLQTNLSPQEFCSYVVHSVRGDRASEPLIRMWEIAAQYERVRKEMPPGNKRTVVMEGLYQQMRAEAISVAPHLDEFAVSASAGRRLAAIAVLSQKPLSSRLQWLAKRLDNPEIEAPFMGYQAARALRAAVAALGPEDLDLLEAALANAWSLAKGLTDPPRLRELLEAELDLMERRCFLGEEADVSTLVSRETAGRSDRHGRLIRNLLIFRTKTQRTWLTFTTAGVFCSLDNRLRGEEFGLQWFQRAETISPDSIKATDRPNKSGLLAIGARRNWLYSRQIFDSNSLVTRIRVELQRAEDFRMRMKRYR